MIFLDVIAGPIFLLPVLGLVGVLFAVFGVVVLTSIIIALFQRFKGKKKDKTEE